MDARKKQQKRLKREKLRREHLEQSRDRQLRTGVKLFLSSGGITHQRPVPARNDRDGWQFHNDLNEKAVVQKAMTMFSSSALLKRFFVGRFKPRESGMVSFMLSRAAQAIHSDAPRKVPYWIVIGHPFDAGYFSALCNFALLKTSTPEGAAWNFPAQKLDNMPVFFSTHALDRMHERLQMSRSIPEQSIWPLFLPCKQSPYPRMFSLMFSKWPIGYCPYVVEDDKVIASTFLLPGMKGTPEEPLVNKILEPDVQLDVKWYNDDNFILASRENFELPPLVRILPWLQLNYDELGQFENVIARYAQKI